MLIHKITDLAQYAVSPVIREGDTVIDATAGNGLDTEFLAAKAGPSGRVYAFDIQKDALVRTAERLKEKRLDQQVTLIQSGHENLARFISEPVSAVMYNLGYLPGGSRELTTGLDTTLSSFKQALSLLKQGGIITVVLYPGHAEGKHEKEGLMPVISRLSSAEYTVLHQGYLNKKNNPPELVVVQKVLFSSEHPY